MTFLRHFCICPVDCVVSDWGDWGLCSQSCGGGLKGRRRDVLVQTVNNGAECPSVLTETQYCIIQDCPQGRRHWFLSVQSFLTEGELQLEVLWGSEEDEKYSANNILSKEDDFSNSTHANYWLAKKGELKGQGFILRVGNSKQKILGVNMKNTHNTTKEHWATDIFKLEGSLLKEPDTVDQRSQGIITWTPEILRKAGIWDQLIFQQMESKLEKLKDPVQTFFFSEMHELRYLWFHLLSFHGDGGGLQYMTPILQRGKWLFCHLHLILIISFYISAF